MWKELRMPDRSVLVGTWRMLTWRREFDDTGETIDALGADPIGFVSYGSDGRVHAMVVRRDRLAPRKLPPTVDEAVQLFGSMLAYTGTYTLYEDRVVHHVDASWNQAWTGSDQVRFYRFDGPTLELAGAPAQDSFTGRMVTNRMTFQKWAP
jgi:Lipocalin-like domain